MSQFNYAKKPNFQSAITKGTAYNAANIVATELGWVDQRNGEVLVACAGLLSKSQGVNDATTLPDFTLVLPKNATYGAGKVLQFTVKSTETLKVTGAPSVDFTLTGTTAGRSAVYVASKSTSMKLVFEYTVTAGDVTNNAGPLVAVGATVTKNGGTILDANTDIAVAITAGDLTGIVVG